MTDRIDIKIEGAEELQKLFRRTPTRLRNKHLRRATRQSAAMVRDEARRRAPARSGKLRRNIRSRGARGKRTYTKAVVFVNASRRVQRRDVSGRFMATGNRGQDKKDAYYWRFLEFGTRKMAARPFIRPAAESAFPRVVAHVVDETNRGIREEFAKL